MQEHLRVMPSVGSDQIPPLYQPLDADDITAFHAARLLLLIEVCGEGKRDKYVEGSTKLAKLDFFVRYPRFLDRAHRFLVASGVLESGYEVDADDDLEAPMIRYRFGPWDPRYRQFVAFLEARDLVRVSSGKHNARRVTVTARGRRLAQQIAAQPAFAPIGRRAEAMKSNLAEWTGTELKDFIYSLFEDEVGARSLREVIGP